jgi:hypothetical protein
MFNSKLSRPMAVVIQGNLRRRERTALLATVKEYKTVQATTLLAVARSVRTT